MLKFVDETLRDGPQSLWATRMRTPHMLGGAGYLNRAGFSKVCVASGASFETAVKFLREDPWDRMRRLKAELPDTLVDVLIRSRNLFGWERYPDEVIELLFRCLQKAGCDHVKIFDGLNDVNNIAAGFRIANQLGLKTSGYLAFSISPVHTDAHFVERGLEMVKAGAGTLIVGDASGLLTADRTRSLIKALRDALPESVPIEFLAHTTMGLAYDTYREAMLAGVTTVTTAAEPLANGESVPSTLAILAIAQKLGISTQLDATELEAADDYFRWIAHIEKQRLHPPPEYNQHAFKSFAGHQIPGGMISNFRNQLREIGLIHRMDEVLEEAARIRTEIGCPIMVTPFSQFVGVQATFNVVQGERYKTVPRELYLYALGHYGRPPAPIDPNVLDRILGSQQKNGAPAKLDFDAQILGDFKRKHGPFLSDEDLLLQLFYGRKEVETMRAQYAPGVLTSNSPIKALIAELAKNSTLKHFKMQSKELTLEIDYK